MTYKERVASGCVDNVDGMPREIQMCVARESIVIEYPYAVVLLNPDEAISFRDALLELFPLWEKL